MEEKRQLTQQSLGLGETHGLREGDTMCYELPAV